MKPRNSSILKTASLAAALGVPLAIVAGCSLSSLFPVANQHPANWTQDHGRAVQAAGGAEKAKVENGMSCTICHTSTQEAGKAIANSPGASSTCYTCHAGGPSGNPHLSDWKGKHSAFVKNAGGYKLALVNDKSCNICHTAEKAGDGTIPPSPMASKTCFTCHDGGPDGSNAPEPTPDPTPTPDPNATPTPATRTYSANIRPLSTHANCIPCHDNLGLPLSPQLGTYDYDKANAAKIKQMLTKSGMNLSTQQKADMADWITKGTPNDPTKF